MGPLIPAGHVRRPVRVEEDIGAARRAVARMAAAAALRPGDPEIVATELAANLVRHTDGGYLLCQAGPRWLELIAVDHGPGLRPGALPPPGADGSLPPLPPPRPGSLGVGLAAVRRLSSGFDYHSSQRGTVILARLGSPPREWPGGARWGGVNVPLGGTGVSGDGWAVATAGDATGGSLTAMVVDGLGHGPAAGAAAEAALAALADGGTAADPAELVRRAHEAMRGTRGGVLAAAVIRPGAGQLAYAGIGNIAGRLVQGRATRGLVSREGTAGTHLPLPGAHVTAQPWEPGSVLILSSDGIRSHWDPLASPGLLERDPSVTAAVIYRDHERGTDDATVLVVRDVRHSGR